MKRRLSHRGLLLAAMTVSAPFATQVHAAGFQLNEHSTTGLGRAFAGEAAYGDNAAAIARNPALATQLEGTQTSVGVTHVNPKISARGEASYGLTGTTVNADRTDYAPEAWVPHAYMTQQLNERWSWGLALNTGYGLSTDLGNSYAASDIAEEAEIITMNINPSVAYRLTDAISLGVGISLVKADATLATGGGPLADTRSIKVEGDDIGWGVNLGATWQVNEALRLGLAYRSEVELKLDGKAESDLLPAYNQKGTLNLDLPAVAELSAIYNLNERLTLSASAQWTEWSVFEALIVDFDDGSSVLLKEENFEDSWRYALGVTYELSPAWTLRAGMALDRAASTSEHRSLSIPDTDRLWYSAGFTYQHNQQLSVDLGYSYLDGDDVDLTETSRLGTTFTGSTSASAQLVGVSVNYQF